MRSMTGCPRVVADDGASSGRDEPLGFDAG